MNWLSFFIGVLVGWIIEWMIDLFYWRRKWQAVQEENDLLRARLEAVQAENRTLEKKSKKLETVKASAPNSTIAVAVPVVDLDGEVQAPEADRPDLSLKEAIEGLKARFPYLDLDGAIGRLRARIPDLDLKGAIAGLTIDFPDVDFNGALADLRGRLPRLGGEGVDLADRHEEIAAAAAAPADELIKIEGIGPRIARLLNDNGIQTFAQLAAATPDHLSVILRDAGPRFQLADPGTWPEQARLAADGAWDQLQALQTRLSAGHEGPRPAP